MYDCPNLQILPQIISLIAASSPSDELIFIHLPENPSLIR